MSVIPFDNFDLNRDNSNLSDDASIGSFSMFDFDYLPVSPRLLSTKAPCIPCSSPLQTTQEEPASFQTKQQVPRMVSIDSMTEIRRTPVKKHSTPYDSLKNLVAAKRDLKRSLEVKSPPSPATTFEQKELSPVAFASVLKNPSPFFRGKSFLKASAISTSNSVGESPQKKRRLDPAFLHKACQKVDALEIDEALKNDASAAEKAIQLRITKKVFDAPTCTIRVKSVPEAYKYPLNIAISKAADTEILQKLVRASPSSVGTKDGVEKENSLQIILKYKPNDLKSVDTLLLQNPSCVIALDRSGNTALHTAVRYGASVEVFRHLCTIYPEALEVENNLGYTPLDLAIRSGAASEDAITFLSNMVHGI